MTTCERTLAASGVGLMNSRSGSPAVLLSGPKETSSSCAEGEGGFDGDPVGVDQGQGFAVAIEVEIGVELLAGDGSIFVGGEDLEVAIGGDGDGREGPLIQVSGVVAEEVAVEVLSSRGGVSKLDPVGRGVVLIEGAGDIDGQDLVDGDIGQEEARLECVDGSALKACAVDAPPGGAIGRPGSMHISRSAAGMAKLAITVIATTLD